MATAKKVPPYRYDIQLTLTPEEAETLRKVCAAIGGEPRGPRRNMDNIKDALDAIGIQKALHSSSGSIYFWLA